jgi:regulator of replication initiation timing
MGIPVMNHLRQEIAALRCQLEAVCGENEGLRCQLEAVCGENEGLRGELEGLRGELEGLLGKNEELEKELARLKAENEDLREKLGSNSSNSSKPPSSDRGAKPRTRVRRKPSGRKRGGQPGHPGQSRKLFPPEACSNVEDHHPQQCGQCCSSNLEECSEEPYRHQVVEIPPVQLLIDEHRLHWSECSECGGRTRAELPEGVSSEGYGPRLTALIVMYGCFVRTSYRMTQALVADLFGVEVSLGTIRNMRQRVSEGLASAVEEAKRYVQHSKVVNADETSYKQGNADGKNPEKLGGWLWVAATSLVAYFEIHLTRATTAAQDLLGLDFIGILVSDRYKGYSWLDTSRRQLCWPHLIRNFKKMADRSGRSGEIGRELVKCANRLFHELHRVRDGTIQRSTFQKYAGQIRQEIRELLEEGASYIPKRGEKSARAKTGRSCKELLGLEPAMWLFVRRDDVEPTNNFGERLLRFAVLWRRMSQGTQSQHGSLFVGRLLTVTETLRLQNRNVLEYLTQVCEAARAGTDPPSLLPDSSRPSE